MRGMAAAVTDRAATGRELNPLDLEIDYSNPPYIPDIASYRVFLSGDHITDLERDILLAHHAAPEHTARNAVLAEALSSTLLIVNGAYGRLGRKAVQELGIEFVDKAIRSHAMCWFEHRDDGFYHATMHHSVHGAIEALGWDDEARTRFGKFWRTYIQKVPSESYWEGRARESRIISRARNGQARKSCIDHYKARCVVCGFDFEKFYGSLRRDFIEVHHVSGRDDEEYQIDPVRDLRPVCSNCHRMLHRDGLKEIGDLTKAVQAHGVFAKINRKASD